MGAVAEAPVNEGARRKVGQGAQVGLSCLSVRQAAYQDLGPQCYSLSKQSPE
jgi:hypothetical protein